MQSNGAIRVLAVVAVLVVIAAAIFIMMQPGPKKTSIGENEPAPIVHLYMNAHYGISFPYSDAYTLTERDEGNQGEREHHVIVLANSQALARVPENGEGPPSITVELFGNAQDTLSVESWIKNVSASNFKLSQDGVLSTTTVASTTAYAYEWDGLYRGESRVLAHKQSIVMVSVSSMDSADPIRDEYEALLRGLVLN